jgi:hypothetical protein
LKNQGFPAIYLGPAKSHAKNVNTVWNPVTQCSLTSRNVVFLNRNYADYCKLTSENVVHLIAVVKNDDTDRAIKDYWNKLLRAIKFTLDTKDLALKMKQEWDQPIKMINGKPDWANIFKTKCTMGATSDSE